MSDDAEQGSSDDMSVDSDDLSTQPLGKLLRNPASLAQPTPNTGDRRRKLRPETIEVQRLKDVGDAQPVNITPPSIIRELICTVYNLLPILPPSAPAPSYLWTLRSPLPLPCLPLPVFPESQPLSHQPTRQKHPPQHLLLSSSRRQKALFLSSAPLFSHLESRNGQRRQGLKNARPQRGAKKYGEIQTQPLRALDGSYRDRKERGWIREYSGCSDMSMGGRGESGGKRRCCRL